MWSGGGAVVEGVGMGEPGRSGVRGCVVIIAERLDPRATRAVRSNDSVGQTNLPKLRKYFKIFAQKCNNHV